MLSRLPTRCRFCKVRFTATERERGYVLHQECVTGWLAVNLPKLEKKRVAVAKKRAAQGRAEIRARKEKIKKISQIEEECRDIVQKIARIRDRHLGCISCEKPASWDGQWHGSHYRSHGGCSSLQFHLWNINKACWICNKLYSGRVDMQKVGIVARYGPERLAWLDAQPKSKKFTREYLARFKKVMGKRARRLERRMG